MVGLGHLSYHKAANPYNVKGFGNVLPENRLHFLTDSEEQVAWSVKSM